MDEVLKWKKNEKKIIVYDQFMGSISEVNCAAASFRRDYL